MKYKTITLACPFYSRNVFLYFRYKYQMHFRKNNHHQQNTTQLSKAKNTPKQQKVVNCDSCVFLYLCVEYRVCVRLTSKNDRVVTMISSLLA